MGGRGLGDGVAGVSVRSPGQPPGGPALGKTVGQPRDCRAAASVRAPVEPRGDPHQLGEASPPGNAVVKLTRLSPGGFGAGAGHIQQSLRCAGLSPQVVYVEERRVTQI